VPNHGPTVVETLINLRLSHLVLGWLDSAAAAASAIIQRN
jgi:hypothetical protein